MVRKNRRKKQDVRIEAKEKQLQINVENRDSENGSKKWKKKK